MSAGTAFRAWSSTMRLVVEDARVLRAANADLVALLDRVEHAASRFRPDSALSIANARAGRPTPIPRLLVDLLSVALRAAHDSDGLVVPTVGPALRALGYDRDIADVRDVGGLTTIRPAPDWRSVRIDRATGLLTVPLGCSLDLGATAKAYTADLAARSLSQRYGTGVLVELGGDLAVAGSRADGWCVKVAESEDADGDLVLVRSGALATSTTTVRRWTRGGRPVHHVVDPRTGLPTDGPWRTATVAAPSAVEANVASTAALVLGADAVVWLDRHRYAARLVDQDGIVSTTAGWPNRAALATAR